MGIKILLLLFALILVGMSILFYILINELESTQKEVKDLFLRDREVREAILTLNENIVNIYHKQHNDTKKEDE